MTKKLQGKRHFGTKGRHHKNASDLEAGPRRCLGLPPKLLVLRKRLEIMSGD